ncbi:MAG: helicase-associated domain-containing protein [Pseudomonadota bacterium]
MSNTTLPFVLAVEREHAKPSFDYLSSEGARKAARFWVGRATGSNAKADNIERLTSAWHDSRRVAEILAALGPECRAVLAVVKRFGGFISGTFLRREVIARGIVKEPKREERSYYHRQGDPVFDLCERLVLLGGYREYYSYGSYREYPSVSLPSHISSLVVPAAPLHWKASAPAEKEPESTSLRAPAQVLVDLEQTARALNSKDHWKVNQGGVLPAAVRNKLAKLLPPQPSDPLEPPDRVVLNYALLCAMGVVQHDEDSGWLVPERIESLARLSHAALAWRCTRAWLDLHIWQDGVGAVPDRDGRETPTRIDPDALRKARWMLAWALTRVAHSKSSPNDWYDLETFLLDLYEATGESEGLSFFWGGYSWMPHLATAARKDELRGGFERSRAFWIDDEGRWVANALFATLVYLGLVERGRNGRESSERWSFRLTDVGKAVFGAPEIKIQRAAGSEQCLTIQPNHEILLYLDSADGAAVITLGRIAARESGTGVVQSFKLTRESVYGALEGGMTLAAIESFLTSRSRNGLPANVSSSLAEWSRKREALVVRSGVALAVGFSDGQEPARGRQVGTQLVVASPRAASKRAKDLGIAVTADSSSAIRDWRVDEHGVVSLGKGNPLVGTARLRRFATFAGGSWRITPDSVRAARGLGIPAEQIVEWLRQHLCHEVPPVLKIAIESWAGARRRAFLGNVVLLQVNDLPTFEALRCSQRLQPFLNGTLAPGCLVVAAERRKEAVKTLCELGFSLDAECKLASEQEADGADQPPKKQTLLVPTLRAIGRGRKRTRG